MDKWLLLMQIVTDALLLLTLLIYFVQWRTMRRQLEASHEQLDVARRGVSAQNLFALISYIQEPEARDSRAWVMQKLVDKPFEVWDEQDKSYASRVCSKFDVVGILVRDGLVRSEAVIGSWGPSIRGCHKILRPFIRAMQEKNGVEYWDDFDWLFVQVMGQ